MSNKKRKEIKITFSYNSAGFYISVLRTTPNSIKALKELRGWNFYIPTTNFFKVLDEMKQIEPNLHVRGYDFER